LQFGLNTIDWLTKRSSRPLSSLETYFDDGSPDAGFATWAGGVGAARFTAPDGTEVQRLRFHVWGEMHPVNVYVLDSTWTTLLSQTVTPSPGWFEVDVSDANIVTNGDFYVAWQWPEAVSGGPWLGLDKALPHHHHSYLGNLDPLNPPQVVENEDYLIRAVVSYPPGVTPGPFPTRRVIDRSQCLPDRRDLIQVSDGLGQSD